MAKEYAKVLQELAPQYKVIGRSLDSAKNFESIMKHPVQPGGLNNALKISDAPDQAIVSVGVENLSTVTIELVQAGVQRILVEKPAGMNKVEIERLHKTANDYGADVLVAYNRRFLASITTVRELIKKDGGPTSCIFEFTEWSHVIEPLNKIPEIKECWFLANSTHVTDLAFHLCGFPKEFEAWQEGSLSWHPSSSRFCGSGITENEVLFSYHADWGAPGRWGVEVLTQKNRYILKPLEELQVIELGSIHSESIQIDDQKDKEFKPGLFNQVKAFLCGEDMLFCTISDQLQHIDIYNKISGYDKF